MAPIWKKQLKVKKAFYFYILFSNVDETNGFETQIVGTRRKVSTRVQDVPIKDTRAVTRPRTRQLHTRRGRHWWTHRCAICRCGNPTGASRESHRRG